VASNDKKIGDKKMKSRNPFFCVQSFCRIVFVALLLTPLTTLHGADAKKPNVLFVVFDDLNNRLGCYGDPVAKSPNLDRLAARGTVFTRNFCQQPICGPSRASFMSGRRPDSLGIWSMTKYLYDLHPDAVTIPQWFMQHGYTSMSIGKVLGGYGKEADFKTLSVPDRRTGGKTKDEFALPNGAALPPNLAKDRLCENRDVPDEACFDNLSASLAITELRALAKKPEPFFLALGLFKPHSPYKVPKRYWDMYRREDIPAIETPARPRNAPEIAFHANHELKLRDNTIVVIIGDNGFHLGEHDVWGKMTLFGWDARVPLIISAPGIGKGGAKTSAISELIDIFPSLTDLSGLPSPPQLDGTSLVPVLKDASASVKTAALTQHPRPALYWGGGPQALPQVMGYALKTDRWSYHEWRDFKTGHVVGQELYDEQTDPLETVNLAGTVEASAQIPALFEQLRSITTKKSETKR
jgi:iduronate 2-sulfatase